MMFGLFKKKHLRPAAAYASNDPQRSFQLLHLMTAHVIMDAWADRAREGDKLACHDVMGAFASLVETLREYLTSKTAHAVEPDSLYARLLGMEGYSGEAFALIDGFVARLNRYSRAPDISLTVLIQGAYAPSEVRKTHAALMANLQRYLRFQIPSLPSTVFRQFFDRRQNRFVSRLCREASCQEIKIWTVITNKIPGFRLPRVLNTYPFGTRDAHLLNCCSVYCQGETNPSRACWRANFRRLRVRRSSSMPSTALSSASRAGCS
jgi:hypothetical protein